MNILNQRLINSENPVQGEERQNFLEINPALVVAVKNTKNAAVIEAGKSEVRGNHLIKVG